MMPLLSQIFTKNVEQTDISTCMKSSQIVIITMILKNYAILMMWLLI